MAYPLRCKTGKTAPSVIGFKNLVLCQEAARGPVSLSPSPTIVRVMRLGLSKTVPKAWEME